MKLAFLPVLILLSLSFSAQESQDKIASQWKEGKYDAYDVDIFDDTKWTKSNEKVSLIIKRNLKNKIQNIRIEGGVKYGPYLHRDSANTEFVRAFSNYSAMVYFNGKSVIIYDIRKKYSKSEIKIIKILGEKPEPDIKDEINAYLENTKTYYFPKSITMASEIASVTPVINYQDEYLVSGTSIDIGLIVKTSWGVEVKTENIGGKLDIGTFNINVKSFAKQKGNNWIVDCSKLTNGELEINVGLKADRNFSSQTLLPVKCDAEGSPVELLLKAFSEYNYIRYARIGESKNETFKLLKDSVNGYAGYRANLQEIGNKKNIETDLILVKKGNNIGYADKTGKLVIPVEFDDGNVDNFKDGLVGVMKDKKCGFVNLKGKVVVPFIYEMVYNYKDGVAVIKKDGKRGYINKTGKEIVPTIYDEAYFISNGMMLVKKDGKYGYLNKDGLSVTKLIYDDAFDFNKEGFGEVIINKKRGLIDKTGKIIIPVEFDKSPKYLNKDLYVVCRGEKYGIIKKDGKMLFECKFDEIFQCGQSWSESKDCEKIVRVKNDGLYGYLKTDGTVFKDCIYSEAADFFGNMANITKIEDGKTRKGQLLLNVYDGKGNKLAPGYEALDNIIEEPEPVANNNYNSGGGNKKSSNPNEGWLVIKNTGRNRLYVITDRGTSSHISPGGTSKWPCHTDIYYCYKDSHNNYNVKGALIAKGRPNCGQVVNASGD